MVLHDTLHVFVFWGERCRGGSTGRHGRAAVLSLGCCGASLVVCELVVGVGLAKAWVVETERGPTFAVSVPCMFGLPKFCDPCTGGLSAVLYGAVYEHFHSELHVGIVLLQS